MKKDTEWLKKEFDEVVEFRKQSNPSSSWGMGSNAVLKYIKEDFKNLINQLDEPEVLSQKWIEDNRLMKLGPEGVVYYVAVDDLQNLLVPKQELPIIPQWMADNIESKKRVGTRLNVAMSEFPEHRLEKELGIDEHECNELYARAWLDGYDVEEEPLYRVSAADMRSGFWFLCKDNDGDIMIGTNKDYYEADWGSLKLTEQEIKDYDERYWAFAVKVEELGK